MGPGQRGRAGSVCLRCLHLLHHLLSVQQNYFFKLFLWNSSSPGGLSGGWDRLTCEEVCTNTAISRRQFCVCSK